MRAEGGLADSGVSVGISASTVQSYLERAERAGLSWPLSNDLDDAAIKARLFTRTEEELRPGRPEPDWLEVHRQRKRGKHVGLQLLHLEYKPVDWKVEPVWEWRVVTQIDSTRGSSDGPYAVAVDHQCNSYLTDSEHFRITKLSKEGNIVAQWPLPGARSDSESSSPRGIAVDGQGNVYVTDTPRDRVYKYSPLGQVVATWGACPDGGTTCDPKHPGRFIGPEGIAVDGAGYVYVAEVASGRIQKLSSDGKSQAIWDIASRGLGESNILGSLAIDQAGFLYVTEAYNDRVVKFDPNSGAVVGRWGGTRGEEGGQFHGPLGVGVDTAGNLYVSDSGNWRVQKLDPSGALIDQWRNCLTEDCGLVSSGTEPPQFFNSRGVAVDGQGTVYVADTANKRLQRLTIVDWNLIPPPDDAQV